MPTARLTSVAEVGGSLKQVQQAFSSFQVARTQFINVLTGFLDKKDPCNITLEALMKNDVMAVLCCPLAQDAVPGIQASALHCLSNLAAADPLLSQVVVSCGVLDSLMVSMSHESSPVQAAANSVLTAVANSTNDFAHKVLAAGVLPCLMSQLQTGPVPVKEAAVKTLNALVHSSLEHATVVCTEELLLVLVALMHSAKSPHSLIKAVVLAMSNIAATSVLLAEALVRHQALPPLTLLVCGSNTPPDLRVAALNCLSHLGKHHEKLADQVASTGVVQAAVQALTDKMTPAIRRNASALLLELANKTPNLAEVVSGNGAPSCLTRFMELEKGSSEGLLAAVTITGSMSSYKASIAKATIDGGTSKEVISCIRHEDADVSRAAAWAVEQMAAHGEEVAMPLVEQGAMEQLVEAYRCTPAPHKELRASLKSALKTVVHSCSSADALGSLVASSTPPELLKQLLRKLEPLLTANPKARKNFVTIGALMRMQQVTPSLNDKAKVYVAAINHLFPDDVVRYYQQEP